VGEGLILIVEDNDKSARLLRDVLEFHGYETLLAENGRDALELAGTKPPRLILMDIQLPDIDGEAVLRELRRDPATAGIPVVALTAFAMPADRKRFLATGFDGYLSKPIDIKELPEQVRRFCELGEGEP
jgi:two-component system cell cycle response regulator DivK